MNRFSEHLKNKYGAWGWMGQRAHDASGVNKVLPLDFIISCDFGRDVPVFFKSDDIFSLEKEGSLRQNWSNEHLEASMDRELGERLGKRFKRAKKHINILPYRSVRGLEEAGGSFPVRPRLYAVPQSMKRYFDNKVLLYNNLKDLGLNSIPGKVAHPAQCSFKALAIDLGLPFVVQYPYGSSGQMTFFISKEEDFTRLNDIYPETLAVFMKYIGGFSLNVNAVIISGEKGPEVICSSPSIQIVGAKECSNFGTSFCGNDYASIGGIDDGVVDDTKKAVESIGTWMGSRGYRGIFGLDLVSDGEKVYVVEVNPRFQNSTALYTTIEEDAQDGEFRLFLMHIAEFLKDTDPACAKYIKDAPREKFMNKVKGSQLILHNIMRRTVISGEVKPGIYKKDSKGIKFLRESALVTDCSDGEFLVSCGVPSKGAVMEPNAPIFKVQARSAIISEDNKSISSGFKEITGELYKRMALCDFDMTEAAHA